MNAGKSTVLLQASHNYGERGMKTMLFTAELDNRSKVGNISSRIGLSEKASTFNNDDNLFSSVQERLNIDKISCVFVDEAQFLTEKQVWELSDVVEILNIPVMCFGLRTDFQGKLFEGSSSLLAIADELKVPEKMVGDAAEKAAAEETNENAFSLFEAKVKEVSLKSVTIDNFTFLFHLNS